MPTVVPQKPTTLFSRVDRKFMPKMPATMAPTPAEKLPMLSVSSSLLTCNRMAQITTGRDGSHQACHVCGILPMIPLNCYK